MYWVIGLEKAPATQVFSVVLQPWMRWGDRWILVLLPRGNWAQPTASLPRVSHRRSLRLCPRLAIIKGNGRVARISLKQSTPSGVPMEKIPQVVVLSSSLSSFTCEFFPCPLFENPRYPVYSTTYEKPEQKLSCFESVELLCFPQLWGTFAQDWWVCDCKLWKVDDSYKWGKLAPYPNRHKQTLWQGYF